MRKLRSCFVSCALPLTFALLGGAPVFAQESSSDVATARKLGVEGFKLAEAGKCDEAIERLSRAEKLHHAPTVLERLGECQVAVGKIVDGTESLQRVVREELPPNAPLPFVNARARAQKALDAARLKVATLVIQVTGPSANAIVIKLDGQNVSSAYVGVARPTDPGDHVIEVSAPGYKSSTKRVTLAGGANDSTTLTLEADPDPPPTSTVLVSHEDASRSANKDETREASASSTHWKTPVTVAALSVGGVALLSGAIFGFLAMDRKGALDGVCTEKSCPPSSQSTLDSAHAFATVSTVGFVAGATFAALGLLLLALPNSHANSRRAVTVVPQVGLGSVAVSGQF